MIKFSKNYIKKKDARYSIVSFAFALYIHTYFLSVAIVVSIFL